MPSLLSKRSTNKLGKKASAGISSSDLVRINTFEGDARELTPQTMISMRGTGNGYNNSATNLSPQSNGRGAAVYSPGGDSHSSGSGSGATLPPATFSNSARGGHVYQDAYNSNSNEPIETLRAGSVDYQNHRNKETDMSPYMNGGAGSGRDGAASARGSQSTLRLDHHAGNGANAGPASSQASLHTIDSQTTTASRSLSKRLLTPLGGGGTSSRDLRPRNSIARPIGHSGTTRGGYPSTLRVASGSSATTAAASAMSLSDARSYYAASEYSMVTGNTSFLTSSAAAAIGTMAYGYTPVALDLQLDALQVAEIVKACGEQIRLRGLDTPLLFSSMAIDLSPTETASLLRSYLSITLNVSGQPDHAGSPPPPAVPLPEGFLQDIRFANPADLAAVIKWALARIGKVLAVPVPISEPNRKGDVQEEIAYVQQRGFLDLEAYLAWKDEERRNRYPAVSFQRFVRLLEPEKQELLLALFTLLSSTTSYSLKNGMTPSRLARLFGALLFGLPEDETFQRTYEAYVRASNATEHLFLAYIRWQASQETLPTRLMEHISGYPSMLSPEIGRLEQHARSMPVTVIEANVRMYSPDLLLTACQMEPAVHCEEWEACRGEEDEKFGIAPQFSDKFRKLINYRGGVQGLKRSKFTSASSPTSPRSSETGTSGGPRSPGEADIELHSSLASKEWGDFASAGFLETDASKLAFDLKESERKARSEKRGTKEWSDFEAIGFGEEEDHQGLRSVLSFDDGLKAEMERWPSDRAEILERLRKAAKKLPEFPYDTRPKVLASPSLTASVGDSQSRQWSTIDETFAEVWADYLLGSGWSNKEELTYRSASFIVVQYKSRPTPWSVSSQSNSAGHILPTSIVSPARSEFGADAYEDPRSDAAWFVISEVVPLAYRAALEASGRKQSRSKSALKKLNLFKKLGKSKGDSLDSSFDPHDVFQPGSGGPTKRINLIDPVQKTLESDRMTYATMSNSAGSPPYTTRALPAEASSRVSLAPSAGRPSFAQQNVASPPVIPKSPPVIRPVPASAPAATPNFSNETSVKGKNASTNGGGGFMGVLRSRSQRMRSRKPVPPLSAMPPELPPKNGSSNFGSRFLGAGAGGAGGASTLPTRQLSFTSDDFETRSLYEPELEINSSPKGHAHKSSRDDHWIDVMLKSDRTGNSENTAAGLPALNNLETSGAPIVRKKPIPSESAAEQLTQKKADLLSRPLSEISDSPQVAYLREEAPPVPQIPTQLAQENSSKASPSGVRSISPQRHAEAYVDAEEVLEDNLGDTSYGSIGSTGSAKLRPTPLQPIQNVGNPTTAPRSASPVSPAATLRAGLKNLDLPAKTPAPAKKDVVGAPREDPFDKKRTVGRVAKIAGQFGGPAKAGAPAAEKPVAKLEAQPRQLTPEAPGVIAAASLPQETETTPQFRPVGLAAQASDLGAPEAGRVSSPEVDANEALDTAMPMSYREPYQPGQPLHSLIEADELESVRSGSTNSRSVR